jgi:hypothetical protein
MHASKKYTAKTLIPWGINYRKLKKLFGGKDMLF